MSHAAQPDRLLTLNGPCTPVSTSASPIAIELPQTIEQGSWFSWRR